MQRVLPLTRAFTQATGPLRCMTLRFFSHAAAQPAPAGRESASTPPTRGVAPADELLREAKHLLHKCRNVLVLTGAGISTESGVADYRSPGRPPHRPTSHQHFMASHLTRQRYWARSLQGYETLANAKPNGGHFALAHSERHGGPVKHIITQNVDLLHEAAGNSDVLHLHGTIENLRCMSCDAISSRREYQQRLRELNPAFVRHHEDASQHASPAESSGAQSHTNLISPSLGAQPVSLPSFTSAWTSGFSGGKAVSPPTPKVVPNSLRPDGDSNLPQDLDWSTFQLPSCSVCTDGQGRPLHPPQGRTAEEVYAEAPMQQGVLKPDLVFFGANVPKHVHARADELLASCDGLLVVGTSLTVWSAFRLMHATLGKPVAGHDVSVIQLADMVARATKLEAQKNGSAANSPSSSGSNTISEGAAILNPVTPYARANSASTSAENTALFARRVPSTLPVVILNQGPTRADPLLAAATNVVKVDHVRASAALKYILNVPADAFDEHTTEADAQTNLLKAVSAKENIE